MIERFVRGVRLLIQLLANASIWLKPVSQRFAEWLQFVIAVVIGCYYQL